jgi:hypothetical protein
MNKTRSHHLYSLLSNAVRLFGCIFLLSLAGCGPKNATTEEVQKVTPIPEATPTENAPHVSPYIKVTVTGVDIRYLDTKPVQVEIVIRGTLPDQCKYDFYSVETRAGQNVKVSLDGIHPADNSCAQTIQTIEYVLRLGRDMPESDRGFSQGDYKLTVNNYQSDFSVK